MHPALSVIFFTTASGAGYGLLGLLGISNYFGYLPTSIAFGVLSIGLALLLITAGLLSSTFHLGHPERAWRAFSQWRSSWLSREGVLALLTYLPTCIFAWGWLSREQTTMVYSLAGLLLPLFCFMTVFTTAMIYASLKTIRAWHNNWVPVVYLALSLMTGLVLLNALLMTFEKRSLALSLATILAMILAAVCKLAYWHSINHDQNNSSTPGTATGLGHLGKVSLWQSPHTQENYLQKEMGFVIARKHAQKLRRICIGLCFVLPLVLTLSTIVLSSTYALIAGYTSILSVALGVLVERWLFFAEAKHTVMLYYGSNSA